jgi:multidrug resistance protein, MATE family
MHHLSAIIKYFYHLNMANTSISTKVDTSYRQIIQLAAPIWISVLITQISFATNNYFLGHVSTSQLAANGVGGIYYMVLTMLIYGFCNGVTVILSRRAGQEDKLGYGNVFSNAFSLGLVLVGIIIAISLLVTPALFQSQLHDDSINTLAQQFMLIRVFGLPFYFIGQMNTQFFISTQNAKYIIAGIIVSTLVNIGLDYALIAGNWGMPALGIRGAAIASICAEGSLWLTSLGIIYFNKMYAPFKIKLLQKINMALSKESLQIASPIMIQYFFSIATWMLFFIYVEHLGKDELAISQILRSVFGLVGAASWALASSCNTMVSNLIGQQKYSDVFIAIKKNVMVSLAISLVLGGLYLLFAKQVFGLYTQDANLIIKAMAPIKVVVIANFVLAISTVIFNAVLGTGNTRVNMLIEFSAIALYIVYIYIVIEQKHASLAWAWGSEFIYWTFILIIASSYLKWGKWQNKVV